MQNVQSSCAGDLKDVELNQVLWLALVYGMPVTCPVGREPQQEIAKIKDGTGVTIEGLSSDFMCRHNMESVVSAIKVGGDNDVRFKILDRNGLVVVTLTIAELCSDPRYSDIRIKVMYLSDC